jgi:hypothetical protein
MRAGLAFHKLRNGETEKIVHKCLQFFQTSFFTLLFLQALLCPCLAWLFSFSFYQEHGLPQKSVLSVPLFVFTMSWMQ